MPDYVEIPILAAAHRCGIQLDPKTIDRVEVQGYCPFCNAKQNHLYLNTDSNKWHCKRCGLGGNAVTLFEDFIEALNVHNQNSTPLVVNSMYVMDDEKQRQKMAAEFYNAVKKEIEEYQERVEHLISTDSQSPTIMGRWVLKIEALEQKKQEYEGILRQQLDELNDEFATLRMFSQELQVRSQKIMRQKAA